MIDISEALKIVGRETRRLGDEIVAISNAVGRVLNADIVADTDLPPFDRSQMDGYAVVAADTKDAPVSLNIVGEAAAGRGWHKTMKAGETVRIMTGAPVPDGADAVQKVELTRESGATVAILEPIESGRSITYKAGEIEKGLVVFTSGDVITANMIAPIASFAYAKICVAKQPRVAIIGTGSEIVPIDKKPGRDQIRNSNSVMLDVFCRKFGAKTTVLPIVKDNISDLKFEIKNAAKKADLVILTGGVSVGKYDHTKTALADLGAEIFFEKVRLKPGKPAVFARLGKSLIFGLPGNPVSAAVTFHLFVRKAILLLQGASLNELPIGFAVLESDAKAPKERDSYIPSSVGTNEMGQLIATPLKWQGSSDFIGFSRANSLIFVPRGEKLNRGDVAKIAFLDRFSAQ